MAPYTRKYRDRNTKSNDEVISRIHRWLSEGADFCKEIHDRAEENNNYIAGTTQWREGDLQKQQARERPALVMNKILQVVNSVANREIMQRYVSKAYGRDKTDAGWAEVANEFMRWQGDQCHAEHEESMAFRSNVASGYSCLHFYFDNLEDEGDGLVMTEEVPIWWMLWDSRAHKQNLVDRRWHIAGKYVPEDEAREEYGDVSPRAKRLFRKLGSDAEVELSGYQAAATGGRWPWDAVSSGRWYNRADKEVFVIEAEWRDVKTQYKAAIPVNFDTYVALQSDPAAAIYYMVDPASGEMEVMAEPPPPELLPPDPNNIDPTTGQPMPMQPQAITGEQFVYMEPEQQKVLRDQLLAQTELRVFEDFKTLDAWMSGYAEVTGEEFSDYAKQRRYVYKYAVVIADELLEVGERPQGFTYEFLTGFPHATREATKFFGLVDVAKGPQDYRNAFASLVLTRLAQSPKAAMIIEEGALDDPDEFADQMANPRGFVTVPDGFVTGGRFQVAPAPTFPSLERELIQMMDQGVSEAAGLSGVDLGQQQDLRRVSGNVVQSVKEASNTMLAILFDSLRRYRKRSGGLLLRMMQEFYLPEQLARIVGDEKAQFIPANEDWPDIRRFDIKCDEAPAGVTERMEFFDFLTRTGTLENWMNQGLLPPDLPFEWVPFLSESDRQKIREHQARQDKTNQLIEALSQSQDPATQQAVAQYQAQQQAA